MQRRGAGAACQHAHAAAAGAGGRGGMCEGMEVERGFAGYGRPDLNPAQAPGVNTSIRRAGLRVPMWPQARPALPPDP